MYLKSWTIEGNFADTSNDAKTSVNAILHFGNDKQRNEIVLKADDESVDLLLFGTSKAFYELH